jgi:LAS superfamily LD-carboxypeptidase LdcB
MHYQVVQSWLVIVLVLVATLPAALTSATERLPWVNPARCLPSCAFNPAPTLVRTNDRAELDRRGRHRVDGAAQLALRDLIIAAKGAGHRLRIQSAFRSYNDQARVFATTREIGRAARPGHSEHQLGTAVDLRLPTTAAIDWLAENAPEFGFVRSYPPGKQRVTGYRPEPWHLRFVGRELAAEVHKQNWSLEELFRARPELGESGDCGDCRRRSSAAPCGKVTPAGRCEGTVVKWCYDGAIATVDCALSQQVCGQVENSPADCL